MIIDTCTLSNLYNGQAFSLLKKLYSGRIGIPMEVYYEVMEYLPLKPLVNNAIRIEKWMAQYKIVEEKDWTEFAWFTKIADEGEAAIMAIARNHNGTVGSDDMRGVVRICQKYKIPLLGTMGILYDAYNKKIINDNKGNEIITNMINNGRRIPVERFEDVLNWFEYGQGKKLY